MCQPCALKPQMYTGVFLSKNLYFARDFRVDGTAALFTHFLTQKSTHLSIRTENKLKETVRQQSWLLMQMSDLYKIHLWSFVFRSLLWSYARLPPLTISSPSTLFMSFNEPDVITFFGEKKLFLQLSANKDKRIFSCQVYQYIKSSFFC